ncbi:GNAT family N-acetyltransferase [Chamaesiphon sp. VAR_48_metabat_403]|uniref:GNAT family N-acetyltransferase n=1 Tax=Chamaesiphon sp. VAR_48_metabat_403 TaxID=2964700 RepID=UPI00286E5EF6|nr:GNAT family N-acetyltransferase [Chamaesiphon sp. VAR_48_metabat_403]
MAGTTTFLQSITTQVVVPSDLAWQECLNLIPHDFYHLPGYLGLEADRINGVAEAIIVEDGESVFFLPYIIRNCDPIIGDIRAINDDRIYDIVSPYGYPGMLVNESGQNTQFITTALNTIYENWSQRNICSAFLRLHPLLNSYIDPAISDRYDSVDRHAPSERTNLRGEVVICDLTQTLAEIWSQIRSNHRTKINKLKRTGFTVKMGSIEEYFDVFIDIYTETMHRVNATQTYYFTRDYFDRFIKTLGEGVNICVVETAGTAIAACLVTEFNGIVQYHLGGTRTEFLSQSPTTMMLHYIIEWGQQRHNRYLNLGGGLGSNQDSLYHFKSGFSKESKSFATMEVIVNRHLYDRLISLRAESSGMALPLFEQTSFFPVYRLPLA